MKIINKWEDTDSIDTESVTDSIDTDCLSTEEKVMEYVTHIIENLLNELIDDIKKHDYQTDTCMNGSEILTDNLESIICAFKDCVSQRKQFLKHFPTWKKIRKENINLLKNIAEGLDKHRKNCNISRIVGSSVGITGGIIATVGAVLIPFTLGLSTPLLIVGGAIGGAGGASNVGTAITETVLIKKNIENAKVLLNKDHKEFEPLEKWFVHTVKFVEAVEHVMSFSAFQKILHCFEKLISEVDILNVGGFNAFSSKIPFIFGKIISKFLLSPINSLSAISNLLILLQMIFTDPSLIHLILTMAGIHKNDIIVFEAIMLTTRIILQIGRLADAGVDSAVALAAVLKGGAAISQSVGQAIAHGVLSGIGIALDIANITLTSIDISNGSKCTSAEPIHNVIEKMQSEMDNLETIFLGESSHSEGI